MSFNDIKPFVFGGVASVTAEVATFPVDTLKARLQVQGQRANGAQLKYRGMLHGLVTICREEGLGALYNGVKPAILRQVTYGTMRIGFYQSFKNHFRSFNKNETVLTNVICAMSSGGLANGIANPTDVLKVRLQVNRNQFNTNTGMFQAFYDIFKNEGLKGLYRGVLPNVQRAAVITGVELPVYDFVKTFLVEHVSMSNGHISTHFGSSLIAGLMAAVAATPIDVVKTRLMNQRNLKNHTNDSIIYKGSIDCFYQTIKYEGFFALYKGIVPAYLRLGPWNIIFFMTYEQLKNVNAINPDMI